MPLVVGVLLPTSSRQPMLGASLYAGMQAYLDQPVARPAMSLRPVTFRPTVEGMTSAMQRVIVDEPVDLVVGAIDGQMAARVRPLVEEHGVPLIVAESGANLLRSESRSPLIAYNTLHGWQASWGLGHWAAQSVGRRAVVMSSCYESGYDAVYAFELGFKAGDGTLSATHLTHVPGRNDDLRSRVAEVARSGPDVVYGLYSGEQAREFVAAYVASPLAR